MLFLSVLTSCERKSVVPEPFSLIAGSWVLVSSREVGEVSTDDGYKFTPDPPQEFSTDFPGVGPVLNFEGFDRDRGISQLSLHLHTEKSQTIVGNNGLYHCSFDTQKTPPEMKLKIIPNGWESERVLDLATYELKRPK